MPPVELAVFSSYVFASPLITLRFQADAGCQLLLPDMPLIRCCCHAERHCFRRRLRFSDIAISAMPRILPLTFSLALAIFIDFRQTFSKG